MRLSQKIAIGSKNPAKIEAVRLAFEKVWPEKKFEFIGVEVSSGVTNQPMSDTESLKGATTRAKKALKTLRADYGVGLEGGLQKVSGIWLEYGMAVVINKKGEIGVGSSPRIEVPKKVIKLVKEGRELGDVGDILFGIPNLKQKQGYFGEMTKGHITRSFGYSQGVIMALVRFLNPQLF